MADEIIEEVWRIKDEIAREHGYDLGRLGAYYRRLGRERGESTDVATTQPVVKFTYEDYRTAPADKRYELLDGDLIMVPAPNLKHQRVLLRLARPPSATWCGWRATSRHPPARAWRRRYQTFLDRRSRSPGGRS